MKKQTFLAHTLLVLALSVGQFGCETTPVEKDTVQGKKGEKPAIDPNKIKTVPAPERDRLLEQALGKIRANDISGGLKILYDLNDSNPEDKQVIFHIARTLQLRDQFRAARTEYQKLVKLDPKYGLAWLYLGEIQQRLGEHKEAIAAFRNVVRLVPNTIDPLRRIAANQIRRGEASQALSTLAQARERLKESKRDDALIELLTVMAYEELGNLSKTKVAVREFLKVSKNQPEFSRERQRYQRWLQEEGLVLKTEDIASLFKFARATLNLTKDTQNAPADIANEASPRLDSFDQTTVFVTLTLPSGLGTPIVGRGKVNSLFTSLARALGAAMSNPKFNKRLYRRCAIRITLVSGKFRELELVKVPNSDPKLAFQYKAKPKFIPGHHGVAFDAGDRQPFMLPAEATIAGLQTVSEALTFASNRSKLSPAAWKGKRVLSFEAREYYQSTPGDVVIEIDGGEPAPRPQAAWASIWASLGNNAQWIIKHQAPNGYLPTAINPDAGLFEQFYQLPTQRKLPEMKVVEVNGRTTIAVRCDPNLSTPGSVTIKDQYLVIRCNPKPKEIQALLSQKLKIESELISIGTITKKDAPIRVDFVNIAPNLLQLAVAGEIGILSIRDHFYGAATLSLLYQRMARPEYLKAAIKAIDAAQALIKRDRIDARFADDVALLAMTYVDQGLRSDGQNTRYFEARKVIRERLFLSLKSAPKAELLRADLAFFAVTKATIIEGKKSELASLQKLLLKHSETLLRAKNIQQFTGFAQAAAALLQIQDSPELAKFLTQFSTFVAGNLIDPVESTQFAGGIRTNTLFAPEPPESGRSLWAIAAITAYKQSLAKPDKEQKKFLTAALVAAEYILRSQVTLRHKYTIANISAAVGGFRQHTFAKTMTMKAQWIEVFALTQVLDIIADTESQK